MGDCYLLSAMSVLAVQFNLLKVLFVASSPEHGIYQVKFFKNGDWVVVTVDDLVPVIQNRIAFSKCADPSEVWVPIMEKAYAKLHGSYQAIESGSTAAALTDLTGEPTDVLNLANEDIQLKIQKPVNDKDSFWSELMYYVSEKYLIGAACTAKSVGSEADTGQGILANHAYGLLTAVKLDNSTHLISLRNPWGEHEWRGAWSDGDSKWNERILKQLNYQFSDDGVFWMDYTDFVKQFNQLVVCRMVTDSFGDMWKRHSLNGEWVGAKAGGTVHCPTWKNNPQYGFVNEKENELLFFLSQPDARMLGKGKTYTEAIGFNIWKTEDINKRVERPIKNDLVQMIPFQSARDATLYLRLPAGKYIVIPQTYNAGVNMKYYFSIFSKDAIKVNNL
uniref:Calpain catalytic domain-containing protein n=1 Tax=Arcella intermedia TaxID=1963864 RepID=A0A6B2L3T8_9EUKA